MLQLSSCLVGVLKTRDFKDANCRWPTSMPHMNVEARAQDFTAQGNIVCFRSDNSYTYNKDIIQCLPDGGVLISAQSGCSPECRNCASPLEVTGTWSAQQYERALAGKCHSYLNADGNTEYSQIVGDTGPWSACRPVDAVTVFPEGVCTPISALEGRIFRCGEKNQRGMVSTVSVEKYTNSDCYGRYYEKTRLDAGMQMEGRSNDLKMQTTVSCEAPMLRGRYYTTTGTYGTGTYGTGTYGGGDSGYPATGGYDGYGGGFNAYPGGYRRSAPSSTRKLLQAYSGYGGGSSMYGTGYTPYTTAAQCTGFLYQTYVREGVCNWERDRISKATCPADGHHIDIATMATPFAGSKSLWDWSLPSRTCLSHIYLVRTCD